MFLGYRKGKRGGTWTAKRHLSGFEYAYKPLGGVADDTEPADGVRVLSFDHAAAKAKEWWAEERQREAGGVPAGPYTVEECVADYLKAKAQDLRCQIDSPKLGRVQATIDAFILPTLGKLETARLTHTALKKWRDGLADQPPRVRSRKGATEPAHRELNTNDPHAVRRRQASVNRVWTVLRAALNHAKAQKHILTDTAWVDIKPFKRVDVPKVRFLSMVEVNAVVAACSPDFQSLLKAALLTGCRCGELTAMLVSEFNEQDGTLYVARSKNGEARYVDLNHAGVQFFAALVAGRKPTEKLFLRANGNPWKESEQKRPMDAACEAAAVEGVTFHILRHTYASHALMAGMTIEVLAQQLGHKDTRITLRHYGHLCPTFKAESVRRNAPSFGF